MTNQTTRAIMGNSNMKSLSARMKIIAREFRVFTSGHVARIAGVAPRTAAKWFDAGVFPRGYRILGRADTGGEKCTGDRRIPREDAVDFFRKRNMEFALEIMGELDSGSELTKVSFPNTKVLLACGMSVGGSVPGYELLEVHDVIQATIMLMMRKPSAVIIDTVLGMAHTRSLVQLALTNQAKTPVPIFIRLHEGDIPDETIAKHENCVQGELYRLPEWLASLSS